MKAKFQVGAEIDFLSPGELHEALEPFRQWRQELKRGPKFGRFYGADTIGDTPDEGTVVIGGDVGDAHIGPREGFLWSVIGIAVTGINPIAESVAVYVNEVAPSTVQVPVLSTSHEFACRGLVLHDDEKLVIHAAGLVSTGTVTVTGRYREVPAAQAWML